MATTDAEFDYEGWLDEGVSAWRRRGIMLAVGGAIVALIVAGVWWEFLSGGGTATAAPQTATVDRGAILQTVSTSGTVSAQQTSSLSFQQSGKVTAVNVTLGQQVHQGDVLAAVESTDEQEALQSANANLTSAQAKLNQTLQGSTASQLAGADQSVVQAQAAYDKAQQAMQDLRQPPSATDVAAAQQAVQSAQAQLGQAQQSRQKLDQSSQDAITEAQTAVSKAQSALSEAQSADSTAAATVSSAQATLYSAEQDYCPDPNVSFCSVHGPLSPADQATLVDVSNTGAPDRAQLAAAVLSANTAYAKALSGRQSADDAVASAQSDLASAQSALTTAEQGPSAADVASAEAAIAAAQVAVQTAQDKLNTLLAGPTQEQLDSAQSDIDTAAAGLKAAQAKRNETYAGALPADIASGRQAVSQAQVAVDQAQRNLDETKLIAPFDGTVAVLNVHVGDNAGGSAGSGGSTGSGSSSGAAIVLNTPNAVRLDLTINETDLPNVKVGQAGTATFDAIPGRTFPIMVDAIGTNPTTTQGVVTYAATAHLLNGAAAAALFGGNRGRFVAPGGVSAPGGAAASGTPGVDLPSGTPGAGGRSFANGTPVPGRTPGADRFNGAFGNGSAASSTPAPAITPAPGMNAQVTIIVAQAQDVLRLPETAVQRNGRDSVVQLKQSDGTTKQVTVQTGLSDGQRIEITSGVNEGDVVLIPTAVASTTPSASGAARGVGGGGGFFIGRGGGGGGGGAGGGGGRGGGG